MAPQKKVLLKVCSIPSSGLGGSSGTETDCSITQVIILGDSGVGKTSLMNQYVRSLSSPNPPPQQKKMRLLPAFGEVGYVLTCGIGTGQQEVQRKLQGYDRS